MANQASRFPYATGAAAEPPLAQQAASDAFSATNANRHLSGFWNLPSLRGQDEGLSGGSQALGAFATGSEPTNPWAQPTNVWNNADATAASPLTGHSATAARLRDGSGELPNGTHGNANYFPIGQTGAYSHSRTSTNGAVADSGASPSMYSSRLNKVSDDSESGANSGVSGGASALSSPFAALALSCEPSTARTRASMDASSVFISTAKTVPSAVPPPAETAPGHAMGPGTAPALAAIGSRVQDTAQQTRQVLAAHLGTQPAVAGFAGVPGMPGMSGVSGRSGPFDPNQPAYPQMPRPASSHLNPVSMPWPAGARAGAPDAFAAARDPASPAAPAFHGPGLGPGNRGHVPSPSNGGLRQTSGPRGAGTPAATAAAGPWSQPLPREPRGTPPMTDSTTHSVNHVLQQRQHGSYTDQQQIAFASALYNAQIAQVAANPLTGHPFYAPNLAPHQLMPHNPYRTPVHLLPAGIHLGSSTDSAAYILPDPAAQAPRDRDPARSMRSTLLEEFRSSRTHRRYELRDIYNHIVEFSGDQHGSRFIQSKLETANGDEKEHVFREISSDAVALMKDVFGNYVVQKFFEHGSQVQKKYLAEQMRGKMIDLSTQSYSCRVVQKALENTLLDQKVLLARELEGSVLRVVKDQNGNHVVQKVIEELPREHTDFVMDALRGSVRELSKHTFGCRIIQRMFEHGSKDDRSAIMAELRNNSTELILDQYGNYVIQNIIEKGDADERAEIIDKVLGSLDFMSKHKFASNVVEKCIQFGTPADRTRVKAELDRIGSDGLPALHHMITDQYGNYVVQKLLKELSGNEKRRFVSTVGSQVAAVKASSTMRQNAALDRLTEELSKIALSLSRASLSEASLQTQSSHETTPPLTNAPNSPESSNPPSVSAGPTEPTAVDKTGERSQAAPQIALAPEIARPAIK